MLLITDRGSDVECVDACVGGTTDVGIDDSSVRIDAELVYDAVG